MHPLLERLLGRVPLERLYSRSKASTFLLLCPELGIGVCVLSNTANLWTRRIAQRLFSILRDR
ncbi:MAG: hypothetical protein ACI835_004322 [Planctomycetota bacterium]|jgi:hypothetical protein